MGIMFIFFTKIGLFFIFKIILMNRSKITVIFLLLVATVFGQQKISVENIFNGVFRAKGMDELQSLKNTDQYTVLNVDQASRSMQIDLYDFATLKKVSNLIDTKNHPALADGIDSYTFDASEKKILIACHSNKIFRHSFTADYFLYDITSKSLTKLFDFQIQEPTFSPDGTKIAYARENNLYVYDVASKKSTAVTTCLLYTSPSPRD